MGLGTGLGLATVYGIVKQHQGHISVYSEMGRGTTFKVYLPQVDAVSDSDSHKVDASHRPAGHETVLVVEDEEVVRQLTCDALETLGYKTLCGAEPDEAIRICGDHSGPIDLVLTDVVLPHMDGRHMFDGALLQNAPVSRCCTMSGYTSNFMVSEGVLENDVHFMQKPFNLDHLAQRVRQILDGP